MDIGRWIIDILKNKSTLVGFVENDYCRLVRGTL